MVMKQTNAMIINQSRHWLLIAHELCCTICSTEKSCCYC